VTGAKGAAAKSKPEIPAALTKEPGTATRQVTWRGQTRDLSDPEHIGVYDALDKETRGALKDAEKGMAAATDPDEKAHWALQTAMARESRSEALDAFWGHFDRKGAGVELDLDAEFLRKISDVSDEAVSSAEGRIRGHLERGGTALPVGDLKALVDDFGVLASRALRAG